MPAWGGWLRLSWHVSLADPVMRPVLLFLGDEVEQQNLAGDMLLAGAPFGQQHAVVWVPAGTREIRLSPADRPGPFGFRLAGARWISAAEAVLRGLAVQPGMALHACGAALIGRPADFRLLLTEALHSHGLGRYRRWKQRRLRPAEWQGFDRPSAAAGLVLLALGPSARAPAGLPTEPDIRFVAWPGAEPADDAAQARYLQQAINGLPDEAMLLPVPEGVTIEPRALPALARAAADAPEAAIIYGDEERQAADGQTTPRFMPGFDPVWTFTALAGQGSLAIRVGFLRQWLAGAPVPAEPQAVALHRMLARAGADARLPAALGGFLPWLAAGWPCNRAVASPRTPTVSVIIPTRDRLDLLRACIESLEPTLPPDAEIVIVDNDSAEPATHAYLAAFANKPQRRVLPVAGAFNFSRLCNLGAGASRGEVLVFLNNDTTMVAPDWLGHLAEWATRPGIGAVGARLLYPDGRVQHAGVVLGIGGYAGHLDLQIGGAEDGIFGRARASHGLLAVTGACLAVARSRFEAVNGFDEANLPVDLNDIDLCLRLAMQGWRTLFCAEAVLVHHESATRGGSRIQRYVAEKRYFAGRWRHQRRADPHFHPVFSLQLTRPYLG